MEEEVEVPFKIVDDKELKDFVEEMLQNSFYWLLDIPETIHEPDEDMKNEKISELM